MKTAITEELQMAIATFTAGTPHRLYQSCGYHHSGNIHDFLSNPE